MAKIAKNTYAFHAEGCEYMVVFSHLHMRDEDGPMRIPSPKGIIKAQHVTTCLFGTRTMIEGAGGTMSANVGVATCSIKDNYNRLLGMKKAFERCLLAFGITFLYVKDKNGKRVRTHPTPEDRRRYGVFMEALFSTAHPDTAKELNEKESHKNAA